MGKRILLNFFHPFPSRSRIGSRLIAAVRDLPNLVFNDVYEKYPDFFIDVQREQDLLKEADLIVLQHPFYWYSCPSLMKEWIDTVYTDNFAYGSGNSLAGKDCLHVISTGGSQEAYQPTGQNRYQMKTLLTPFELTASLCGMNFMTPFIVHSAYAQTDDSVTKESTQYRLLLTDYLSR